jgi:hypothetical protein
MFSRELCSFALALGACLRLSAQVPAAGSSPPPDILVLNDDERLSGHLVSATSTSLTFKSDLLGNITTDWKNVRELRTQGQYAVIPKGAKLRPHMQTGTVPQGTIQANAETLSVTPEPGAAARAVPLPEAAQVMEESDFQKQVQPPPISFFNAWSGTITAGASIVQATQESHTFTGAVALVRAIPTETNFPPRNRTTFNFNASEGSLLQPNEPRLKTEIVHADGERDEYFTGSHVYGFGQAAFDHNYSQGLTLQQSYGGGIGWTVIDQPNETLDLKGNVDYIRQQFQIASADHNLIGSSFSEALIRKFGRGINFTEQLTVTPAWNEMSAWMALGNAALNVPVYKRFSFTLSVLDTYLHDPPLGFKKNSLQATTGLTYSLR